MSNTVSIVQRSFSLIIGILVIYDHDGDNDAATKTEYTVTVMMELIEEKTGPGQVLVTLGPGTVV